MGRELARVRLRGGRPSTLVIERVAVLLGSPELALGAMNDALVRAGMSELPRDPEGMLAFTTTHLLAVLHASVDPREVASFLAAVQHDLEELFGEAATPRSIPAAEIPHPTQVPGSAETPSGLRGRAEGLHVALVDEDAVARSALARTLVRMGGTVHVASTFDDLSATEASRAHVLYCNLDAPGSMTAPRNRFAITWPGRRRTSRCRGSRRAHTEAHGDDSIPPSGRSSS